MFFTNWVKLMHTHQYRFLRVQVQLNEKVKPLLISTIDRLRIRYLDNENRSDQIMQTTTGTHKAWAYNYRSAKESLIDCSLNSCDDCTRAAGTADQECSAVVANLECRAGVTEREEWDLEQTGICDRIPPQGTAPDVPTHSAICQNLCPEGPIAHGLGSKSFSALSGSSPVIQGSSPVPVHGGRFWS